KVPYTALGALSLRREVRVLGELGSDPRLEAWRALLPEVLAAGEVDGQPYLVERLVRGEDARQLASSPSAMRSALLLAAGAIAELHARTAATAVADEPRVTRFVDEPLRALEPLERRPGTVGRLRAELRAALLGPTVPLAWTHGDFVPD